MSQATALPSGLHYGVPFDVYLGLDAISSSRLRDMGRSPAYCRWRMDNPTPPTAAMILGSLVDTLLLEPEMESQRFAAKDYDARTNAGKARRDEIAAMGLEVVTDDDYDRARNIVAAIKRHPFWLGLSDINTQATAYVQANPGSKARPDILATYAGRRALVDLKVCRQATQDVYPRACWGLWHPQQLAWYRSVLAACGHVVDLAYILAVHPLPPHEVTAYEMTTAMLDAASVVVEKRADAYADCCATGVWPDGDPVMALDPPEWAMSDDVSLFDED